MKHYQFMQNVPVEDLTHETDYYCKNRASVCLRIEMLNNVQKSSFLQNEGWKTNLSITTSYFEIHCCYQF